MSDLTNSKSYGTAVYPVHASDTSGLLRRCEPFLTPELLKSRFLKGINLKFRNGDVLTDDDLKDRINLAMNEVELLIGCTVTREAFKEKVPFDHNLYKSYIHVNTEKRPIVSVEELAIVSANDANLFTLPSTWLETANFSKGLINIIPILAAYGVMSVEGSAAPANAGIAFLSVLSGLSWVPAYWQVKYTSGLSNKEGNIPTPVNELIGCIASITILSEIAATNIYNSQSQSVDGVSQSSSGPGVNIYVKRIEDLTLKKEQLTSKLKGIFSNKFLVGNL